MDLDTGCGFPSTGEKGTLLIGYSSLNLKFYWPNFGCCRKGTSMDIIHRNYPELLNKDLYIQYTLFTRSDLG